MKFKYLRKKLQITQEEAATTLNMERYIISTWENGHVTPRKKTIAKINETFRSPLKIHGISAFTSADFGTENSVKHEYA